MLFVRNIDARSWELHFRDPESSGNQTEYFSHGGCFLQVCEAGDKDIVNAMVERTQVNWRRGMSMVTIHHCTWQHTMVTSPVVQYLLGQGADEQHM